MYSRDTTVLIDLLICMHIVLQTAIFWQPNFISYCTLFRIGMYASELALRVGKVGKVGSVPRAPGLRGP